MPVSNASGLPSREVSQLPNRTGADVFTMRGGGVDRGDSERGAALVEFALVLPLLAMLVVGLFSSAMLYDGRMQLTHAAREGARYGASVPEDEVFASGTW